MYKRYLIATSLCLILGSSAFAADPKNEHKDTRGGFLNYEGNKQQQQDLSEKNILLNILAEQRKQTAIQSEILEILKVTHDLPRKVVVNGKECISNSSADCFVMPIIGDAARLPVMKKWLENPTVENALEYYKWQSKYLNHTFNVGYSLEFASKNTANPFASTPRYLGTGTDRASVQRRSYVTGIIKQKLSKNMEIAILLGRNFGYDTEYTWEIIDNYLYFKDLGIKTRLVFEDQETLSLFAEFHEKAPNIKLKAHWENVPRTDKVVSPNTFKDKAFEAHLTPMYVLRYNDIAKQKAFTQVIGIARERQKDMIRSMQRALILFGVVKAEDFSGSHAEEYQTLELINRTKTNSYVNDGIGEERAPAFREVLEKQISKSNEKKKTKTQGGEK